MSAKGIKQSIEKEMDVESIAKAEGSKASKGFSSAFDSIKANAGPIALAAGAAFVGFAAKGVAAFKDVAIEAGRFADVTGLAVDDASRWIAVGDDIGVSSQTMETAFGKMNVEIGKGGAALAEFGIDVVKAADGTVDANATFLNAIDVIRGIEDPTKKAQAAQAAFGRGWKEMSELIGMGSTVIVDAMGRVSDAQIVDEGELQKARDLRASLDNLSDSVKDVAIDIGEQLTPAIIVVADLLSTLAPIAGDVFGVIGDLFIKTADEAYAFGQTIAEMADALPFVEMVGLAEGIEHTSYEFTQLERHVNDNIAAWQEGVPTMDAFVEKLRGMGLSQDEINIAMSKSKFSIDENTAAFEGQTGVLGDGSEALDEHTGFIEAGSVASAVLSTATSTLADDMAGFAVKATAAREANEKLVAQMLGAIPSAFDYEQSVLALDSAYSDYQTQVWDTAVTMQDATVSDRDKEQAMRDLRQAEIDNALAAADTAAAYATEMGAVDGSRQSIDLQIGSLQAAQEKYPELRDEIQVFIDKLAVIPTDITTDVDLVVDPGSFTAALLQLDAISKPIFIPVTVGTINQKPIKQSMAGRFVPGGSSLLTTAGELSGARGDEAILPLGDPARLRQLLGNSRIGPRVLDALGAGIGSGGGGGSWPDTVTLVVEGEPITARIVSHARDSDRERRGAA